jgi:hypothetical protein
MATGDHALWLRSSASPVARCPLPDQLHVPVEFVLDEFVEFVEFVDDEFPSLTATVVEHC